MGVLGGTGDVFQDRTKTRKRKKIQLVIPLGQRIHGMGTKIGSKYRKTRGKVKNYPPILGAAEGRPHKGYLFLYFSSCLSIFGPYFGTHFVNSLSQGEPVRELPVYLHPVWQAPNSKEK